MHSQNGFEYGVQHYIVKQEMFLLEHLIQHLGIDSDQAAKLLKLGSIYLNHQRVIENLPLKNDDYLRVHSRPRRFFQHIPATPIQLAYESKNLIVAIKPPGLPVHATVDNIQENLQLVLEKQLAQPLFLTHRLDVPTQGLIVYAKSEAAQKEINQALRDRGVEKIYTALVSGSAPSLGRHEHFMEVSPRAPKKIVPTPEPGTQNCILDILSIEENVLKIHLITGRTHQIRAQLAFLGSPIVGDTTYNGEGLTTPEKIELWASSISLKLSTEEIAISLNLKKENDQLVLINENFVKNR